MFILICHKLQNQDDHMNTITSSLQKQNPSLQFICLRLFSEPFSPRISVFHLLVSLDNTSSKIANVDIKNDLKLIV